ncbi:hypothetical protein C4900_08390 [Acidiferrobacter thiooxydans]|uniref:Uncharacterized protein n=1 Tax=Acidiferrobacter thiooxydans TaxID=163359 RepID=A0A1C2G2G7_9GAMM|nr:hypothetical protein C4900_08390 [Acidiferrobacter thiooxydans]
MAGCSPKPLFSADCTARRQRIVVRDFSQWRKSDGRHFMSASGGPFAVAGIRKVWPSEMGRGLVMSMANAVRAPLLNGMPLVADFEA